MKTIFFTKNGILLFVLIALVVSCSNEEDSIPQKSDLKTKSSSLIVFELEEYYPFYEGRYLYNIPASGIEGVGGGLISSIDGELAEVEVICDIPNWIEGVEVYENEGVRLYWDINGISPNTERADWKFPDIDPRQVEITFLQKKSGRKIVLLLEQDGVYVSGW